MTASPPCFGDNESHIDLPCRRFGSRVLTSNLPLPALPLTQAPHLRSDLVIERVYGEARCVTPWIHHWQEFDDITLSLARQGSGYWLHFPELADFELQFAPDRIRVFAAAGTSESTLEHLLVDQVLPRFVAHLDSLVAHASAVTIGGRHALFLGQSGWGKSTLAALLHASGHQVLSDDCVQLQQQAGQVLALSTYPSLRLLPDSLDEFFHGRDDVTPMAEYSDKLRVPLAPCAGPHAAAAVHAIYLLGDPTLAGANPSISTLPPRDTCRALIEHSFRLDLSDRDGNGRHFARCSEVARVVPAFELRYPRDYAQGPALVGQVARHLASLPPSC